MPPDPTILAFDTSAAHCAAALLKNGVILGECLEHLSRGQAERLMPMLEELLTDHGLAWRDIDALAVGIGPGNFTGIRISVSAARGLALGLDIPAVGVSIFEVMRLCGGAASSAAEIISLEAPRGEAYVQPFRVGEAQSAPRQIDPAAPPADLRFAEALQVRGYRAEDIARSLGASAVPAELSDIAQHLAQVARRRLSEGGAPGRPAPLYVRAADAAPPRDPAPVVLP